jgi:uncharacterized Tic20 family protein
MPFIVTCPGCKARLKAPEALAGRTIKCPGCSQPVHVKAPAAAPAPPARPKAAPPPARQPVLDELEEVEDEVEPRPPAGEGRGARGRKAPPRRAGEDDHEEERPRKKPRRDEEVVDDDVEVAEVAEEAEVAEVTEEERPRKQKAVPPGPTEPDERSKAMLLYVLALFGPLVFVSIILWVLKRQESRFIDHHGKNLLNFWITLFLVGIILSVGAGIGFGLTLVAGWLGVIVFVLCGLASLALSLWSITLTIIAALRAKNGVWYTFPATLRLLK